MHDLEILVWRLHTAEVTNTPTSSLSNTLTNAEQCCVCMRQYQLCTFWTNSSPQVHPCIVVLPLYFLNHSFCTGPSTPLQPSNLMSTGVTHNRTTIQWTVPMIAYTPETYTVCFGTSPGSLTPFSQQRQSGDNFTATNLQFSIELTGLAVATRYYYQVEAINNVGSNQSTVEHFTTNELRKRFVQPIYTYTL